MVHSKELERIRKILLEEKHNMEAELSSSPDGELYCLKRGERWYYYQLLPKKGNRKKEKRIGITRDVEKVFSLVRKMYLNKALIRVNKDVKVLDMAIKHYLTIDEETVMADFLKKHPELSMGIYHGLVSDEVWADDYERQKDFYEKERKHTSPKGDSMLSKNEMYIAARLDNFGIPYRYEDKVHHPDIDRVPDFTIRRPRDGKIIYWEHIGMQEEESYVWWNDIKYIEYRNAGIVPWDNLIVTFDTKDGGIDGKIIDAMIHGWLL